MATTLKDQRGYVCRSAGFSSVTDRTAISNEEDADAVVRYLG